MKLSQIVNFKNRLEDMTPLDTVSITYKSLGPILHSVKNNDLQFDNLTMQLEADYQNIICSIDQFEQTIEILKNKLDDLIAQLEPNHYSESFRLYSQEMIYDTPEYILNRRLNLSVNAKDFIKSRIQVHSNWQHSGIIIRPGREEWISHLVGCDPLYLVDHCSDLLEPAVLRFNDQYQRRLRTYLITDSIDNPILHALPDQQFSYCLTYNFFNYKPMEIIKKYIKEMYNKLKPGGSMAMTINDCDRVGGVLLAESNFMCYTPRHCIIEYAREVGFDLQQVYHIDAATTWLEFNKSGVLKSLKGGQSLAKLLYKDEYTMYTKEQIKNIKQQAHDLNIGSSEELEAMPIRHIVEFLKQRTSK